MSQTFTVPSEFSKIASRVDHTFDITFNTSELPAEQAALLFPNLNKQGTLAFKMGAFSDKEIEELPETKEFKNDKTPSQRLRAVIFVLWKQHLKTHGVVEESYPFDDFYKKQIEAIINSIKNMLEPEG